MKPSHKHLLISRRYLARITTLSSCVAAAAIALASPLAPQAVATFAQALKAAQAEAAVRGVAPASVAKNAAAQRVQISSAAAAQVKNEVITLDARQQALLPSITNAGGQVLYRTQSAYNGIAVMIDPRRIS